MRVRKLPQSATKNVIWDGGVFVGVVGNAKVQPSTSTAKHEAICMVFALPSSLTVTPSLHQQDDRDSTCEASEP